MSRVLVLTVGGSFQPIVTAITRLQPDRVLFVCSERSSSQVVGEGTPCEIRDGNEVRRLPNIVEQTGIQPNFDRSRDVLVLKHEDVLEDCYEEIVEAIRRVQREMPGCEVCADYTGGTKTMSIALAMAGVDLGAKLYLEAGPRTDIKGVAFGEVPLLVATAKLHVERVVNQWLPRLLEQYNYAGAVTQLDALLQSTFMSSDLQSKVQSLATMCRGFEAWDRLDYEAALQLLEPHMSNPKIQPVGIFLRKVASVRKALDLSDSAQLGSRWTGYEIVEDLVRNAERRAATRRYDDSVARLYRAVELTAQVRLLSAHRITTSDVDVSRLPDHLQQRFTNNQPAGERVQVGLVQAFELLEALDDSAACAPWRELRDRVLDALDVRNNSLMAHGLKPITEVEYAKVRDSLLHLIELVIGNATGREAAISAPQLPASLEGLWLE